MTMSVAEQLQSPNDQQSHERSAEFFRSVNERILELEGPQHEYDLMCECEEESCTRVLRITAKQYEAVRAEHDCFVVLPGHERPTDEIISRSDQFVIVCKPSTGEHDPPAGSQPVEGDEPPTAA
jgi:hypothetical protein